MCDFFCLPAPNDGPWQNQAYYLYDSSLSGGMAYSSAVKGFSTVMVCPTVFRSWFAPIDKNPKYDGTGFRCEGFLFDGLHERLVFVEIKDRKADAGLNEEEWTEKAIAQLQNTIDYFRTCHPTDDANAKVRKAYIANPQVGYVAASSLASQSLAFAQAKKSKGYILSKGNTILMGL